MDALAVTAAAVAGLLVGLAVARRRASAVRDTEAALVTLVATQRQLGEELAQMRAALGEVRGRLAENGMRHGDLTAQVRALHRDVAEARAALAALQRADAEAQRRHAEFAATLSRLEAIVVGARSRGVAGERVLATVLESLPPAFKAVEQPVGGRVVEFAFRLPNGRLVPIDSKWVAAAELDRLQRCADERERTEVVRRLEAALARKVDEVASYLDPSCTIGLAVVAVPDALYAVTERLHVRALERGVVIVGYGMAVPYLLTVLHLCLRLAPVDEATPLRLAQLEQALQALTRETHHRLPRAVAMLDRAQRTLRHWTDEATRTVARWRQGLAEGPLGVGAHLDTGPDARS